MPRRQPGSVAKRRWPDGRAKAPVTATPATVIRYCGGLESYRNPIDHLHGSNDMNFIKTLSAAALLAVAAARPPSLVSSRPNRP